MPVVVICLEGCHGSGKTALTHTFESMGFPVLDEGFMSMPETILHPQSLIMETTWVCAWYQRLLDHVRGAEHGVNKVIIADRSPLSAVFYAKQGGALLEPLIRTFSREVAEAADLHVVTVHLSTDRALLWSRIQERLAREPARAALREGSVEWMDAVLTFYASMRWDAVVPNNHGPLEGLASAVLGAVTALHPCVHAVVSRVAGSAMAAAAASVTARCAPSVAAGSPIFLEDEDEEAAAEIAPAGSARAAAPPSPRAGSSTSVASYSSPAPSRKAGAAAGGGIAAGVSSPEGAEASSPVPVPSPRGACDPVAF